MHAVEAINDQIVHCGRCPRLVAWREAAAAAPPARFRDQTYWARPVPGLGDPSGTGGPQRSRWTEQVILAERTRPQRGPWTGQVIVAERTRPQRGPWTGQVIVAERTRPAPSRSSATAR